MRTSVIEPAGPLVDTAAEGTSRRKPAICGSPRRSIRGWSTIVTDAGVCAASSGARDAVTTIALVSMGVAWSMVHPSPVDEPVVTEGCAAAISARPTFHRLGPAGETNDGPGQVSDL